MIDIGHLTLLMRLETDLYLPKDYTAEVLHIPNSWLQKLQNNIRRQNYVIA
jgi:hypothetical protein